MWTYGNRRGDQEQAFSQAVHRQEDRRRDSLQASGRDRRYKQRKRPEDKAHSRRAQGLRQAPSEIRRQVQGRGQLFRHNRKRFRRPGGALRILRREACDIRPVPRPQHVLGHDGRQKGVGEPHRRRLRACDQHLGGLRREPGRPSQGQACRERGRPRGRARMVRQRRGIRHDGPDRHEQAGIQVREGRQ